MDAAPPATVASKVAKHVRKGEPTTSRKMRNFLLDAAEAWVQCVSTRRWIWTRGGADPVYGSRVTCEDGSRALMALEDDAAALVPSNPRVKKDEHDSGEDAKRRGGTCRHFSRTLLSSSRKHRKFGESND
jgi:hypothetical protein